MPRRAVDPLRTGQGLTPQVTSTQDPFVRPGVPGPVLEPVPELVQGIELINKATATILDKRIKSNQATDKIRLDALAGGDQFDAAMGKALEQLGGRVDSEGQVKLVNDVLQSIGVSRADHKTYLIQAMAANKAKKAVAGFHAQAELDKFTHPEGLGEAGLDEAISEAAKGALTGPFSGLSLAQDAFNTELDAQITEIKSKFVPAQAKMERVVAFQTAAREGMEGARGDRGLLAAGAGPTGPEFLQLQDEYRRIIEDKLIPYGFDRAELAMAILEGSLAASGRDIDAKKNIVDFFLATPLGPDGQLVFEARADGQGKLTGNVGVLDRLHQIERQLDQEEEDAFFREGREEESALSRLGARASAETAAILVNNPGLAEDEMMDLVGQAIVKLDGVMGPGGLVAQITSPTLLDQAVRQGIANGYASLEAQGKAVDSAQESRVLREFTIRSREDDPAALDAWIDSTAVPGHMKAQLNRMVEQAGEYFAAKGEAGVGTFEDKVRAHADDLAELGFSTADHAALLDELGASLAAVRSRPGTTKKDMLAEMEILVGQFNQGFAGIRDKAAAEQGAVNLVSNEISDFMSKQDHEGALEAIAKAKIPDQYRDRLRRRVYNELQRNFDTQGALTNRVSAASLDILHASPSWLDAEGNEQKQQQLKNRTKKRAAALAQTMLQEELAKPGGVASVLTGSEELVERISNEVMLNPEEGIVKGEIVDQVLFQEINEDQVLQADVRAAVLKRGLSSISGHVLEQTRITANIQEGGAAPDALNAAATALEGDLSAGRSATLATNSLITDALFLATADDTTTGGLFFLASAGGNGVQTINGQLYQTFIFKTDSAEDVRDQLNQLADLGNTRLPPDVLRYAAETVVSSPDAHDASFQRPSKWFGDDIWVSGYGSINLFGENGLQRYLEHIPFVPDPGFNQQDGTIYIKMRVPDGFVAGPLGTAASDLAEDDATNAALETYFGKGDFELNKARAQALGDIHRTLRE